MFVTNCIAGTELTHDILPGMLLRRSGHIITIASIAGIASLPYMAVYAATKAANVLFNLTLQTELQNTGVSSVPTRFDEGVLDATPCRLLSISVRQTKKDCQRSWVQLGSKTAQKPGKTRVWQIPESRASQPHSQILRNLQNLHLRFKSGRRLHKSLANSRNRHLDRPETDQNLARPELTLTLSRGPRSS
jgi:hypothetical protein